MEPSIPCERKTYWGESPSHLGARHQQKARSLESGYRVEHRWQPDKATIRSSLWHAKETNRTTTIWGAKKGKIGVRTRSKGKRIRKLIEDRKEVQGQVDGQGTESRLECSITELFYQDDCGSRFDVCRLRKYICLQCNAYLNHCK